MSPHPSVPVPPARPLVVCGRPELLDELLRLCAASGVEVDVAPDLPAARRGWPGASLVVVDAAAVGEDAGPPSRRTGVVLVGDTAEPSIWRRAVAIGADTVLELPGGEPELVDLLADARDGTGRCARVLGVVGGRGGAGATTLAAAIAVTGVRRGLGVLLVDLDPLGGGIDLALGIEDASGLRWPDLASARGRMNGSSLRDALPRRGELPVLSWDRGADVEVPFDAARAVLDAAVRTCDLVVVDLPRSAGPAAVHVAGRADEVLVVVPAEVRAVASAERVLRGYAPAARSIRAVVRGPAPTGLLASAVGDALGVGIAGELRSEPGIAQALDRGEAPAHRGRGPLAEFCGSLLDEGAAGAFPSGARRGREVSRRRR